MPADFTVVVIPRDGVPRDGGGHGVNWPAAANEAREKAARWPSAFVAVFDADDPERGYFFEEEEDDLSSA